MATFWGKSCSFGLPYVLFVLCIFVVLVISRFGFEGATLVLIVSVPGHCLPFTIHQISKSLFPNFIADTINWVSEFSDGLKLFCINAYRNQVFGTEHTH